MPGKPTAADWQEALKFSGFVASRARLLKRPGVDIADLVDIGLIAVARSLRYIHPDRPTFLTYIRHAIDREIRKFVATQGFLVSVTTESVRRTLHRLDVDHKLGRSSEWYEAKSAEHKRYIAAAVFVNRAQPTTGQTDLSKYVLESVIQPQETDSHLAWEEIEPLIGQLKPREQFVIRRVFGIGEPAIEPKAIARQMGINRSNVSKVKMNAIRKLRRLATVGAGA